MKKGITKWAVLLTTIFLLNIGVVATTHEFGHGRVNSKQWNEADPSGFTSRKDWEFRRCRQGVYHWTGSVTTYCGTCLLMRTQITDTGWCTLWSWIED